jgi:hypothetical protein
MTISVGHAVVLDRCIKCGSYYEQRIGHTCDTTRPPCAECGVLHDGYSSHFTGMRMCLHVATHRYQELAKTVFELQKDLMRANLSLARGVDEGMEWAKDS